MKTLTWGIMLVLSLSLIATEASAYSWFYGSYSPYNYGYVPYYRSYSLGYTNPYLMDRALRTVERDPMPRFALTNTNSLYSFVSSSNNYYPKQFSR